LSVSLVLPTKNEAKFVKKAIEAAKKAKFVGEVVVVDGGSTDGTPEIARRLGARVVFQSQLRYPGKGVAMRDGFYFAKHDVVAFVDADIKNITPEFIEKLCEPVVKGEADFAKGTFGRKAGRVTELVAKPLLRLFYPELLRFSQPLSGEIAGTRDAFNAVSWEPGWGVDVGILIDVCKAGFRVVEVDLGFKDHDMKPLHLLTEMAYEVAEAILKRAARDGKLAQAEGRALAEALLKEALEQLESSEQVGEV